MKNLTDKINKVINDVLLFSWYTGIWGFFLLAAFFYAKTH